MEHMTAEQFRELTNENNNNGEQILRNKVSSARGRAFEGLLMRGCNYYRQKEIAIINKVNEPYIVTKISRVYCTAVVLLRLRQKARRKAVYKEMR